MHQTQETLEIRTPGRALVDVTAEVQRLVAASAVRTGLCVVFCCHTSCSLLIQENADPAVLRDLERWMSELAPESRHWEHDSEGADDMPAHARSALTRSANSSNLASVRSLIGSRAKISKLG